MGRMIKSLSPKQEAINICLYFLCNWALKNKNMWYLELRGHKELAQKQILCVNDFKLFSNTCLLFWNTFMEQCLYREKKSYSNNVYLGHWDALDIIKILINNQIHIQITMIISQNQLISRKVFRENIFKTKKILLFFQLLSDTTLFWAAMLYVTCIYSVIRGTENITCDFVIENHIALILEHLLENI